MHARNELGATLAALLGAVGPGTVRGLSGSVPRRSGVRFGGELERDRKLNEETLARCRRIPEDLTPARGVTWV